MSNNKNNKLRRNNAIININFNNTAACTIMPTTTTIIILIKITKMKEHSGWVSWGMLKSGSHEWIQMQAEMESIQNEWKIFKKKNCKSKLNPKN